MLIDDIIASCSKLGVQVRFLVLPDLLGAYSHKNRLIMVNVKLSDSEQEAVLLHEYWHAVRGDEGCQSSYVEEIIDRKVAARLVSPVEYAMAEQLYEGNRYLIAEELGLPFWVVERYLRV